LVTPTLENFLNTFDKLFPEASLLVGRFLLLLRVVKLKLNRVIVPVSFTAILAAILLQGVVTHSDEANGEKDDGTDDL
jgi:hypothetical protein